MCGRLEAGIRYIGLFESDMEFTANVYFWHLGGLAVASLWNDLH